MTKVAVLGASGMLGHVLLRLFHDTDGLEVVGTARSGAFLPRLSEPLRPCVVLGVDAENPDALVRFLAAHRPDIVINCIGLIKQLDAANDPLAAILMNALLPHRLAQLCAVGGARLIHVSTDCVFSGTRGGYTEDDVPDAGDLYGRSKLMGEVDAANAVTLRTSIIGPELGTSHGLVGWFLAQEGEVRGFTRAIFSGLPTVELGRVIRDHILPRPDLRGVWHVSAEPIDKYRLLRLVGDAYGKAIGVEPDDRLVIDRSLRSDRFRAATGYSPPQWPELVRAMQAFG